MRRYSPAYRPREAKDCAPADSPAYMRAYINARGSIDALIRAEIRFTGILADAQAEHVRIAPAFESQVVEVMISLIRDHAIHTRDRLIAGLVRQRGATPGAKPLFERRMHTCRRRVLRLLF